MMGFVRLTVSVFLTIIYLVGQQASAKTPLHLVVPHFSPYSYIDINGAVAGIAIDKVAPILKEMNVDFTIELVSNYARAMEETRSGRKDGFFLASKNEERDKFAVFSEAVTQNRWSWFLPYDSPFDPLNSSFKDKARIGTQLKTNTHKWLLKNGYNVTSSPRKVDALPELIFQRRRADAVFLAEAVFLRVAQANNLYPGQYRQVVEVSKPFGIYISKTFLDSNPQFMELLNATIAKYKSEQH